MLRLNCEAKQYAWGQPGKQSLVAQLARCGSGLAIAAEEPYAELWMGTHPSGPSTLMVGGRKLQDWIEDNMDALGHEVLAMYGPTLPFLFKILSVETALSIQSHPDKALAEQLHSEKPEVYVDSNHKPEMAIAIRDFEALCGFATVHEISESIEQHPELRTCVGDTQAEGFLASRNLPEEQQTEVLKRTFTALMTCSPAVYKVATRCLHERLLEEQKAAPLKGKNAVFMKVFREFPEDIGTMALFFLNYLCLHPGESIFLPANEPHAYLSGELLEAMASSDNVIRAGLTPKLRDTEVLCDSLTYKQGPPSPLQAVPVSDNISIYKPPVEEFQILKFAAEREGVVAIPPQQSPMILVVLQAEGVHSLQCTQCPVNDPALESLVHLSPGLVLFIPAMTHLKLHSTTMPGDDEEEPSQEPCNLLAYAATANDRLFDLPTLKLDARVPSAAASQDGDAVGC